LAFLFGMPAFLIEQALPLLQRGRNPGLDRFPVCIISVHQPLLEKRAREHCSPMHHADNSDLDPTAGSTLE
jgi:hypothetical protein